jgi:hypothetical protein
MSSNMSVKVFSPLLLAAITVVGGGLAAPAAAQRVEVFVNGQRVTDIVINGGVSNGANGHVNGGAGYVDSGNYVNGANGQVDDAAVFDEAADAYGYVNGANGGNGEFVDGANGGDALGRGLHSHSHVGPYDECFRDRVTGMGHCTGRQWGRHSGPHRGLYRENSSTPLF